MISKIEILTAAKEYPNVGVAFEDAVNSCIKYASEARRYDGKPGLWGRAKLARLQFNYAHCLRQVLSIYRDAIRVARPISDLDSLATITIDEAEFRMLPEGSNTGGYRRYSRSLIAYSKENGPDRTNILIGGHSLNESGRMLPIIPHDPR